MSTQIEDAPSRGDAASGRTQQVFTATVSVLGTVLVAFISILPQLRDKNVRIEDLQTKVAQLQQQQQQAVAVGDSRDKPPPATDKKLLISGTVVDLSGRLPLASADVYLIPLSNPKLMATTDEAGRFRFKDMPDQRYWIVVRDSASGSSSAGFIDEDNSEARFKGAIVRYRVEK